MFNEVVRPAKAGWGSVRQAVIRYKVACLLCNTLKFFSLT